MGLFGRRLPSCCLGAALAVTVAFAPASAADRSGRGTAEKPFKVFLILFRGCEDACKGFKDYFATRKLPIDVVTRDVESDRSKIPQFVAEAKAGDYDLVTTWGTSTAVDALGTYDNVDPRKHITHLPVVFMIVSQPVEAKLVPSLASSGRNITGTSYLLSEETQLKAASSYLPFQRLAVVYNPVERNSVVNVEQLRLLSKTLDFELIEQPVPLNAENQPIKEAIPDMVAAVAQRKPQFLYQGPDTFLNINRDALTTAAVAHGIPVFAAGEAPVIQSNALLGVVNRYYTIGQLTASKVEQVLIGKVDPKDIPIEAPRRYSFLVNMRVAKDLKLYPPMKILKFAEIVE